jgi:hypothetical protein
VLGVTANGGGHEGPLLAVPAVRHDRLLVVGMLAASLVPLGVMHVLA